MRQLCSLKRFPHKCTSDIVAAVDDWDKNSLISKVDLILMGKRVCPVYQKIDNLRESKRHWGLTGSMSLRYRHSIHNSQEAFFYGCCKVQNNLTPCVFIMAVLWSFKPGCLNQRIDKTRVSYKECVNSVKKLRKCC